MENASKALIIAGSILISILIVGLGVIIYNNVSEIAGKSSLGGQEISSHNAPFENYFGVNVSGSNVKALITAVNTNNNQAAANDEKIGNHIYLTADGSTELSTSTIRTGRTYTVALPGNNGHTDDDAVGTDYWKNGFIKTIVITVNTGTTTTP